MLKIIDRYIFREILIPFVLTVGTLLLVLLTDQLLRLVELLINKGVSLMTLIRIFLSILPAFLVIAIPAGVLIGVIIAFNRLSGDNEIIALQANGVSHYRLLIPAGLFSLVAFIITFGLSVWGQPWAGKSLKKLAISLVQQRAAVALEAGMFNEPFEKMVVFIEEMPTPSHIKGILIYDLKNTDVPILTLAKEGILLDELEDNQLGFRLLNGSQHRFNKKDPDRHQLLRFGSYDFRIDLTTALGNGSLKDDRLSPDELRKAIVTKPDQAPRFRRLLAEYYKNYAFPFSSLLFGLIGVPVGLSIKRAGHLGGFAVGLLIGVFYYFLLVLSDFFTASGFIEPMAAAWFPNLILGILAFAFITFRQLGPGWVFSRKRKS